MQWPVDGPDGRLAQRTTRTTSNPVGNLSTRKRSPSKRRLLKQRGRIARQKCSSAEEATITGFFEVRQKATMIYAWHHPQTLMIQGKITSMIQRPVAHSLGMKESSKIPILDAVIKLLPFTNVKRLATSS